MSPWLRAGLIGAAVLVVLNLLGLIPCVGIMTCILALLVYGGVGALAGFYMPPVREAGPAAGQGALAAVLAALIGGIVNMFLILIQNAITGTDRILSAIPPEAMAQFEQAGLDPRMLETLVGPLGATVGGGICCGGGLVLAAILGAIGGAIFAGIQPE